MSAGPAEPALDPTRLASWLEIRPDNTVAIRTGVADLGQGTVGTGFRQIVAEELRLPFEAVSEVVAGDTDRTLDGGIAAGFMSREAHVHLQGGVGVHPASPFGRSALNVQKAAAFAYQALLERGSAVLGVPAESLTASGGSLRSGSAAVTYAELVEDAPLDVELEVAGAPSGSGMFILGEPPIVAPADYAVIGTSPPNPRVPAIVRGTARFVGDVRRPGMLHARTVHPPTLGSTLERIGSLDPAEFPSAEVIVQGNLVAVVSPDEWEAMRAAIVLAETTRWTEWHGLPGSDGLVEAMLETDWSAVPEAVAGDGEAVEAALDAVPRTLEAWFVLPYYKHAPISPEVAVADVRADGSVHVWASSQHLRALQARLARMLEIEPENVVVHFADGAGGFGRTVRGDAGPEAEAVVISRACGRPVRLQWTREEDFAWSTQQAPYLGSVAVGLGEGGRMEAVKAAHHAPGTKSDPLLGAVLAGLPIDEGEATYLNTTWIEWPYDGVPMLDVARGAPNVGEERSPLGIGLRHRSMRSPVHLQQNFAVESMINEAALAAGADPIRYRLDHTSDGRLIRVLECVREMSGWQERPSPAPTARASGGVVEGRGVGVAIRHGAYFAAVAQITVDTDSGEVAVGRYWLAADVGIVINPRLLRLNLEGGTVMGLSQTLHEEVQFNGLAITSTDFASYPILTMAETPEIEIEIVDRRDAHVVGQGSEPPNMVPPVAVTGAFLDATGVPMRRLPLRAPYVRAELRGN